MKDPRWCHHHPPNVCQSSLDKHCCTWEEHHVVRVQLSRYSEKLRWQWNITSFNTSFIFKWQFFPLSCLFSGRVVLVLTYSNWDFCSSKHGFFRSCASFREGIKICVYIWTSYIQTFMGFLKNNVKHTCEWDTWQTIVDTTKIWIQSQSNTWLSNWVHLPRNILGKHPSNEIWKK